MSKVFLSHPVVSLISRKILSFIKKKFFEVYFFMGNIACKLWMHDKIRKKSNFVSRDEKKILVGWVGWLVVFYGISTFLSYLTPNPFLQIISLFQTIQFNN